jgi:hypothetical protein
VEPSGDVSNELQHWRFKYFNCMALRGTATLVLTAEQVQSQKTYQIHEFEVRCEMESIQQHHQE